MEKSNHHGSGFTSGFLLGLIVGAAVVFLIATKKGKQILKMLTENGVEGVEEIQHMMAEADEEYEAEEEFAADMDGEQPAPVEVTHSVREETASHPHEIHHIKPLKRFFRGVKKGSN